ncbi:MAG: DNA repair protein RecO [Bacteroidetes bacterium]|nr:MAG: DNA repair protein RecO [Bacteroidota bacterium]
MIIKTRGIVFHARKYSETSLIADIFTEEKGLRSYIISGVRSKKAKVSASLLQMMSVVDLVAYHRDDRDLTRIREIKAGYVYQSLPFDVRKSAVGQFMVEVARKTIREMEANNALFDFLMRNFLFLDQTTQTFANVHLHFLLELTAYLGFLPSGEYGADTPVFDLQEGGFVAKVPGHPHFVPEEKSRIISQILHAPLELCHEIRMTREVRHEVVNHMLDFYRLHIDHFPTIHAHRILREVLG